MEEQQNVSELGWHMTGTAEEVADILVEFAEDLRRGDVTVWKEKRELHIDPSGKIELSVKADREGSQDGLSIDMQWNK